MIYVNCNITNPWSDRWDIVWDKSGQVGKHRAWEFNGYRTNQIVNVELDLKPKGDHAGVRIMIGLFGYATELHFYDTRHWDYDTNTWECHQ